MNADIRKHCDELAEQGTSRLLQICTGGRSQASTERHLPSRLQPRPSPYQAYDRERGVRDIKDTIDAARGVPGTQRKVGLLGYCLGALMVFMTAVRNDASTPGRVSRR